jgi:hypothetical protein
MSVPNLNSYTDYSVLSSDGHTLSTTVTAPDGTKLTSSLDLDSVIGNVNGVFSWGGTNFSQGAQNIQMVDGYQLEADLPDNNGDLAHAIMYIGSTAGTDADGKPAIQHAAAVVHSTAHAVAENNAEANAAVASQATTTNDSNSVQSVATLKGDASTYWPDDNAPAAGSHISRPPWETTAHFVLIIIECIFRMIL